MIDILKQNDLEEFFDKKYLNAKHNSAYGMITTTQHIEVCNLPVEIDGNLEFCAGSHYKTYLVILNRIYNLGVDFSNKELVDIMKEIKKGCNNIGICYTESTSICIRYSNENNISMVIMYMPALINSYQEEELIKLNEFFKSISFFNIHIEITNIDPILQQQSNLFNIEWFEHFNDSEESILKEYNESELTQIDYALKFMRENNRICEVEPPTLDTKVVYDIRLENKKSY